MVKTITTYDIENVVKELKEISKDKSIPEEYREWASDGINYADRNPDAVVEDYPANIFSYINSRPMPERVRDLVEGILIQEINARNSSAACALGSLYYTGMIGEQSYAKAREYYELSAKEGNEEAIENLGYVYYYGRDCEIDYEKAFHYFSKGAFLGRINSLYKIGDMYKNGYFVEKDEDEAYKLYSKCLDMLAEDADKKKEYGGDVYIRYADCNLNGIGCQADPLIGLYWASEAEFYFRRKDMNGDPFAKEGIEWCLNVIEKCRSILDAEKSDD